MYTLIPSRNSARSGSALLVTLLLVSLLLLMVVTFSALVRIELRKITAYQQQVMARAQARLALELAMAQLQDLAGPDQRVTATGDLFRAGGGNLHQPALNAGESARHWAGVWTAGIRSGADPAPRPFLGWLVSGMQSQVVSSAGAPLPANSVLLLGSASVAEASMQVRVPRLSFANGGSLAWWTADEGVKARFDLGEASSGPGEEDARSRGLRGAQRHAVEFLSTSNGQTLASQGLDPAAAGALLPRMAGRRQLPLAAPGWEDLRRHRHHDISFHSQGVLANVREGGLRRDLSLAFEMPLAEFVQSEFAAGSPHAEVPAHRPSGFPAGEQMAPVFVIDDFSPHGIQPGNSPDDTPRNPPHVLPPKLRGPSWHLLRNFARQYLEEDPDRTRYGLPARVRHHSGAWQGMPFFPDLNGWNIARRYAQDPVVWTYAENYSPVNAGAESGSFSISEPLGRPAFPSLSPVPIRFQIVTSVRIEPSPDNPALRVANLYLDPIVTLWNPYNVPVTTGTANGQPLQLSVLFFNVTFRMRVNGTQHARGLSNLFNEFSPNNSYNADDSEAFQFTLRTPAGFVMAPGEVVVFSGTGREVSYFRNNDRRSHAFSGVNLDLEPGITAFLPLDSGILFENPWRLEFAPDAELEFMFAGPGNAKFLVAGVNRTGMGGPFFGSLEARANVSSTYTEARPASVFPPQKQPFGLYEANMKNESSSLPINMLAQFNPRAAVFEQGSTWGSGSSMYSVGGSRREDWWDGFATRLDSWDGDWLRNLGRRGYWGRSNQAGDTQLILFEVPREPLLSLAAFQHLQVGFMGDEPAWTTGHSRAPLFTQAGEAVSLQPLARSGPPATGRSPFKRDVYTQTRPDWAYLMNEALWDGYYFSGLSRSADGSSPARQRYERFLQGVPLPQGLLTPWHRPGTQPTADTLFDGASVRRDAPALAPAHMLLRGAFNVNSTSVEAWKAVLATTRNLAREVHGSNHLRDIQGTSFARTAHPLNQSAQGWHGIHELSDAQIASLAEAIVREVRVRGPFLSLSEFVNRRLTPDGHVSQQAGALQAAIDATISPTGFTNTLRSRGLTNLNSVNPWVRPQVDQDSAVAAMAPGQLSQADVLTVLGPLLSARSDTFVIRAYGETPDGSRAWCEAVVQRVPEYVDSSRRKTEAAQWDPAAVPPPGASYDTAPARRRFHITSFRWLTAEEI